VAYAGRHGAPAVEAYPRAGAARTADNNAWFGTEAMFRRAGFRVIRKPLKNLPRNWVPRVTMRIDAAPFDPYSARRSQGENAHDSQH
jgi:hypothetical protein